MAYPFKWITVFLFALTFCFTNTFAQSDSGLVTALNKQLIPLRTLAPDTGFADLRRLKIILKDKAVIGIGEATHGTREFFLFKHRMLEFLVKEIGVKTFVIEADFAGTQLMNDYVVDGKGDVNIGLRGMGFGVWMTQEFVDMANWVKANNATLSPENKVRFWGCDMQWGTSAMQVLKDHLAKTGQFTPEMNTGFEAMKKYTPALTNQERKAIRAAVSSLTNTRFADVDADQAAIYERDVRELQQFVEYMDARSAFFPTKQSDVRDKYMAENCEWIYKHTGQHKMMIWAHNGHINKNSGSDGFQRMGMFLADSLKDKYYAMGFDLYSGSMRSYDMKLRKNVAVGLPPAREGSSGAIFSQCSSPNFILDVKSASADPVINAFLTGKVQSSFYGAEYIIGQPPHYVTHKLADTYDAIIFIRETTASTDIKTIK